MPRNLTKRFFKQNGKTLSPKNVELIESLVFPKEAISTLSNLKLSKTEQFLDKYNYILNLFSNTLGFNKLRLSFKWVGAYLATSVMMAVFLFQVPLFVQDPKTPEKYSLFASKPLTMDSTEQDFSYRDSRSVKIDAVFKAFNCPMTGLGDVIVEEADKNAIPYWVVAAIAFQESSCGKNTPVLDGVKTKNAWGWATYGDKVFEFDSFDHGIKVVSKYLSKQFYSRGIDDLCDIMKIYTPPSNGSWCNGVGYFGDFIQNYQSP